MSADKHLGFDDALTDKDEESRTRAKDRCSGVASEGVSRMWDNTASPDRRLVEDDLRTYLKDKTLIEKIDVLCHSDWRSRQPV